MIKSNQYAHTHAREKILSITKVKIQRNEDIKSTEYHGLKWSELVGLKKDKNYKYLKQ